MSTMNTNRHRRSKGRYAKQTHKLRNAGIGIVATFVTLGVIGACAEDPAEADVTYLPCAFEDQEHGPCFWDASERGNGVGHDFIVQPDGSVLHDVPISDVR